jgi:murein DD-endopeptidase MepM/ murein hydrolase activator NlpD
LKRALKKREKAVLNNNPNSNDAQVEQTNYEINPKITRRVRVHRAAMIGLAISMGATSLLVTRQSDQAQAAAPVGSQKATSTMSAASETEMKFAATKLESPTVLAAGALANSAILEPTVVSQAPGLEAKWQIASNKISNQDTASQLISPTNTPDKNSVRSPQEVSDRPVQATLPAGNQLPETAPQLPEVEEVTSSTQNFPVEESARGDVESQLKAQQEFALNRLQEKSNRLRNSLAELRSEQNQNLLKTGTKEAQSSTVANKSTPEQAENLTDSQQSGLISDGKQNQETSTTTPKVITQLPGSTYQVQPGDTLAEIATNYGTSISEIVRANNLSDPNQLQINQKLIIPTDKVSETSSTGDNFSVNTPTFNPRSLLARNNSVTAPSPKVTEQPGQNETPTMNSVSIPVPIVTGEQERNNYPSRINVNVPTPIATDNQEQNTIPVVVPKALPTPGQSYGLGGETPLPISFSQKLEPQKPVQKVSKAKGNERIRSLQAEIERLRYKYRSQQTGVAVTGSENNSPSVPVTVESSNNSPVSSGDAIQIAVPQVVFPAYSNQRPKTLVTASAPTNEPINPEFLPGKTGSRWNSPRSSSGIKLTVPPARTNASESLGKLRGTFVSPALPPIAAVDIHLPRSTEDLLPSDSASTGYIWPAKGVLTSGYGWRWGRMHRGIDIANSTGTPIYASSAGTVEKAGWNSGGYGIVVDIRHNDGSLTRYGHNSRVLVQSGQKVQQGQQIAAMGSTGFSTGPHIHFEVHPSGKGAVNPIAFLPNRI